MIDSQVTIVFVARERFSYTKQSLESVYEYTRRPFNLVYIDGGSPRQIKSYLQAKAQQLGFQLIRRDYYLSPNEARNLGLRYVESKYVVFIDNDVIVTPGWLDSLIQCAEETAAWIVGPLIFKGEPAGDQVIHMVNDKAHIQLVKGKRRLVKKHRFSNVPPPQELIPLQSERCDLVEFHCILVRTNIFERLGHLDEKLLSTREHIDLCLTVQGAGGFIYLAPNAVVTYVPPTRLAWSDYMFFMLRWSDAWNLASVNHFFNKWHLDKEVPEYAAAFRQRKKHRYRFLSPLQRLIFRIFGRWLAKMIEQSWLFPMERILNRMVVNYTLRNRRKLLQVPGAFLTP